MSEAPAAAPAPAVAPAEPEKRTGPVRRIFIKCEKLFSWIWNHI
jgi:hypothetical protein